jgi:hypothetical protein
VFESFPGAGPVYIPRLLTAFGEDRSRWGGSVEFLCHSGIAPVTKKSGKSCLVHRRLACSNFVRQTFQEFAAQSIQSSSWARACYDRMRSRGFRHPAAVRSLAYKWIRIMYRCWMDSKPYDEEIYLASLRASIPHCSRNLLSEQTSSDVRLRLPPSAFVALADQPKT